MNVNNPMRVEGWKIDMILDYLSGHPKLTLSYVKLFFLRPNKTFMTLSMDVGIIKKLKHHNRMFLNWKRSLAADFEQEFNLDLLLALDWLKMSWPNVTPTTIKYCFQHVGFKDVPVTEYSLASTHQFRLWSTAEEAGLVSEGLTLFPPIIFENLILE